MKRILVIFAVLVPALFVPALTFAQAVDAEAAQQVQNLCKSLNEALVKADIPVLNTIFANEFIIIRPNGTVADKAVAVKDVESGKTKFESIEELDSKTHVYGNTAVTTTLERVKAQVGGNPVNTEMRNTYVSVMRDGRWMVVQRQMTPVISPKPAGSAGK
jgi:hypothetical protein